MVKIELPSSSFAEFVFVTVLMAGLVIFGVIMAFLAYRKRHILLKRLREEMPAEIGRPLSVQLFLSPTFLLYLLLVVLGSFALWEIFEPEFSAFEYDGHELRLQYHGSSEPMVLNWSNINEINLQKKGERSKWNIVIKTQDGRVFKSVMAPTYHEIKEIESAYLKIKEAHKKSKELNPRTASKYMLY